MDKQNEEAAKLVTDAAQIARDVIQKATLTASAMVEEETTKTTKALSDALREVFGENEKAKRFVDITKIPLICKSILDIHENIKEIKEIQASDLKEIKGMLDTKYVTHEAFNPVKSVVYGLVAIILLSVGGAVIALIIK